MAALEGVQDVGVERDPLDLALAFGGERRVADSGGSGHGKPGGDGGAPGRRPPPPPRRILPLEAHPEPHPRGFARDLRERPQETAAQLVAGREAEVVVVGDVEELEHGDEVVALAEGPGLLDAHAPVELLVVAAEAVAAGVEPARERGPQGDELAGIELDNSRRIVRGAKQAVGSGPNARRSAGEVALAVGEDAVAAGTLVGGGVEAAECGPGAGGGS